MVVALTVVVDQAADTSAVAIVAVAVVATVAVAADTSAAVVATAAVAVDTSAIADVATGTILVAAHKCELACSNAAADC